LIGFIGVIGHWSLVIGVIVIGHWSLVIGVIGHFVDNQFQIRLSITTRRSGVLVFQYRQFQKNLPDEKAPAAFEATGAFL